MSQISIQERDSAPPRRRLNFSDDNRDLHLQAFFNWLPTEFHEMPLIDWTQLPSRTIGYFVNTVGDSPFAVPLAIAAFAGVEPQKPRNLLQRLSAIYNILSGIQAHCGVQDIAGLTSNVWETFVTGKNLAPKDYAYFRMYAVCTGEHIPAYLEKLNPRQYAHVKPYVLPRLPRKFLQKYLPTTASREGEKQRRKEKSDVLVPLHTLLIALVRFRKQSIQRLWSAYYEALTQAQIPSRDLPLFFSYEDELVTINHDAQTIADVRLEKRPVTLRFRLWDLRSWVKEHSKSYSRATRGDAKNGKKGFAKQQFFIECLNPAEELLWFGDLIKYRIFHQQEPGSISPEDAQHRRQILAQIGTVLGLTCAHRGVLTPGPDLSKFLSNATTRTDTLLFDAEALCRGALFASALAALALTNGCRMCELLQVSADRFKVRPYVVKGAGQSTEEQRVMRLQHLLPKGKSTEAERKLFPISDWTWELLCEIAEELRRAHEGRIPVVHIHPDNLKSDELSPERYLFQWDATPDGKSGAFAPEDVTNLLRFILYGLEFRTKEGEPFSVSVHLLRHVMAFRGVENIPPEEPAEVAQIAS